MGSVGNLVYSVPMTLLMMFGHTRFIFMFPLCVPTATFAFLASLISPVVPRSIEIFALRVRKEAWGVCDFPFDFRRHWSSNGMCGSI